MRAAILLSFLLAAFAPAAARQPAEEQLFPGPRLFCGYTFSLEIGSDETLTREEGPDFITYALLSKKGGFGIYEGWHADTFENTREWVEVPDLGRIERLRHKENGVSYLFPARAGGATVVHLYGQLWRGDERDFPHLRRVRRGSGAAPGCSGPTQPSPPASHPTNGSTAH